MGHGLTYIRGFIHVHAWTIQRKDRTTKMIQGCLVRYSSIILPGNVGQILHSRRNELRKYNGESGGWQNIIFLDVLLVRLLLSGKIVTICF